MDGLLALPGLEGRLVLLPNPLLAPLPVLTLLGGFLGLNLWPGQQDSAGRVSPTEQQRSRTKAKTYAVAQTNLLLEKIHRRPAFLTYASKERDPHFLCVPVDCCR